MSHTLPYRQSIVSRYIDAKDNNKPWLMQSVFSETAMLDMKVNTAAIEFPAKTVGVKGITELLVREFGKQYENVYTFCLVDSVAEQRNKLFCHWLVGMTDRLNGDIKVGCGAYNWSFDNGATAKVQNLTITLACMDILEPQCSEAIFTWLSVLPYPWVERAVLLNAMPVINKLQPINNYLDFQGKAH